MASTCSTRPTICQVEPNIVERSAVAISGEVYQVFGIVRAVASDRVESKRHNSSAKESGMVQPSLGTVVLGAAGGDSGGGVRPRIRLKPHPAKIATIASSAPAMSIIASRRFSANKPRRSSWLTG